MNAFSVTFSNVLLTLFYLLPGWLICRSGKVRPDHMGSTSAILLYICAPGMFLNALVSLEPSESLSLQMLAFFGVTMGIQIIFLALLFLLLGKRREDFSSRIAAIASMMGNVGFFGLPIVRAAFPQAPEAAAYSCIFCATMNILAWTVGVFVLTGNRKYISLRAAFVNPTVLSVALGIVLYLTGARNWLPSLAQGGFSTLGSMTTPLCMFILGIRLATMSLRQLVSQPATWLAVFGKLVIFPLFSYLLVLPLPMEPVFKASVLILSATPCASIILNLAEIHKNGQELAANCALLSTLLSVITIPLLSLLI